MKVLITSNSFGKFDEAPRKRMLDLGWELLDNRYHHIMSEEEMMNHPKRNMLTNALGIWSNIRIDLTRIDDPVDTFLLCSDGLHGYVPDSVIAKVMLDSRQTLQAKSKQLMNLALLQGGYDNITIILIQKEAGDKR